jgi:hypothetical protein
VGLGGTSQRVVSPLHRCGDSRVPAVDWGSTVARSHRVDWGSTVARSHRVDWGSTVVRSHRVDCAAV